MTKIIDVNCTLISDWASFHDQFAKGFRFPGFYGRNSAAWVDCMTTVGEMTDVGLRTEDVLTVNLIDGQGLKDRAPELLADLFEMVALVNLHHLEAGEPARLCVSGSIR